MPKFPSKAKRDEYRREMEAPPVTTGRTCPDGAALNIKGEHFPCQTMADMAPECDGHEGWAHSNRDAEAIWQ